jgi:CRP/FNR family transcriptional regulator, dissimilatory nitrate respiration regulator
MFSELAKTSILKGFATSEIIQLLSTIHYQVRSYKPDDIIAYAHDNCDNLFILLEGHIRGEMNNYNDKNVIISDIHAPDTFAEAFLFADKNKLLVNIIANTKAKILIIYKKDLIQLLNNNRRILENYLSITSNRFVVVTEKIKFMMMKTVKEKLANYILDLEKENQGKTSLKLGKTHKELAALFGITRPVLTRNLLQLKNDSLIEIKNKEIKIIDREKLIQLLK